MNQIAAIFSNMPPQSTAEAPANGAVDIAGGSQFANFLAQEQSNLQQQNNFGASPSTIAPVSPLPVQPSPGQTIASDTTLASPQQILLAAAEGAVGQTTQSPPASKETPESAIATPELTVMALVIQNVQAQPPVQANDTLSALPAAPQAANSLLENKGAQAPIQPLPPGAETMQASPTAEAIAAALAQKPPAQPSKPNAATLAKRGDGEVKLDPAQAPPDHRTAGNVTSTAIEGLKPLDAQLQRPEVSSQGNQLTATSTAPQTLPVAVQTQSFTAALIQQQSLPNNGLAQTPVPLTALAVHIARKFETGSSQFEISLHPADLGKLDISMNVSEDGRVHAVLRAERAETLELLQRDSRSLEQQLRQAGLDVGSNALSFQLSNGNGYRQNPLSDIFSKAMAREDGAPSADESISNYIAVPKRDGLDIRV